MHAHARYRFSHQSRLNISTQENCMLKLKALLTGMVMVGFAGGVYAATCLGSSMLPKGCTCQLNNGIPIYTPPVCKPMVQ
jgi:hypothetical protein